MVTNSAHLLETKHSNGVLQLTLNRPQAANALDSALYHTLAHTLDKHDSQRTTRLVILTGSGNTFCAGMDIKQATTSSSAREIISAAKHFIHALFHFSKPVIAAVFGPVTGIGVTMLLHCDLVLAARDATFETPFASVGIVPEFGSSVTFHQLGTNLATRLLLMGERVDAAVMQDAGAVQCVQGGREETIEEAIRIGEKWSARYGEEEWEAVLSARQLVRRDVRDKVERAMEEEFKMIERQIEAGVISRLMQKKVDEIRRAKM